MTDRGTGSRQGFTDRYIPVTVSGVDFEDAYKAERSKLMRYLMSLGASQHEADDAVQQAFADALARWDTIRTPRAWLYKAATHEYYRADARSHSREMLSGTGYAETAEPLNSGDIVILNEEHEQVQAKIAALPAMQRHVMALILADFTTSEIAQILSCTEAAVRQNKARGRDSLARQLGVERRNPQ